MSGQVSVHLGLGYAWVLGWVRLGLIRVLGRLMLGQVGIVSVCLLIIGFGFGSVCSWSSSLR